MSLILQPPGMRESLTTSLEMLGRARKLARLVQASALLVVVILLPTLLFCLLDALRPLPAIVRAAGLILTIGMTVQFFYRRWLPAWHSPTDSLAVALELEQLHPQLQDTLASAVAFARAGCAETTGTPQQFRAAVIRAARRLQERYDFQAWIPAAAAWRWVWLAAASLVLAAIPVLLDHQRAIQALIRFADPFGAHPWPTRTHIDILEPDPLPVRLARGESWSLVFVVRGVLPEQAEVEIVHADGEHWLDHYPLTLDPVRQTAAPVTVRWDGQRFRRSFQFRIRANDCVTPWHAVTIVPPPQFLSLRGRPSPQFRVVPPAYCGLTPTDLPDAAAVLEVPVGSVLHLQARCDTPLADARLAFAGPTPPLALLTPLHLLPPTPPPLTGPAALLNNAYTADIPLQLDADGTLIVGAFQPAFSGIYVWKLTDRTGLTCTRLLEIRVVPDPVPTIALARPRLNQDPNWYLPEASLHIALTATDLRYGLRQVTVEYQWQDETTIQRLQLFDGPIHRHILPALLSSAACALPLRSFRCEQPVSLTTFRHANGRPPQAGDVLHLRVRAHDWDDVTPCKEGGRASEQLAETETPVPASSPFGERWDFKLTIVTEETLLAQIQRELAALVPESLRLRELHRQAEEQIQSYATASDDHATAMARERLIRTEQLQRQLRYRLEDPRDGLLARVQRMQTTVQINRLSPMPTVRRLQAIQELLQRLSGQDIPVLDTRLWELRETTTAERSSHHDRLTAFQRQQQAVQRQLQMLVELLSEWSGAAGIRSDAHLLLHQLQQQMAELQRLGEKVPPGVPAERLPAETNAVLTRQAARLDTAADQAATLLGRAARLVQSKQSQAEQSNKLAAAAEQRSVELQRQAEQQPAGSTNRATLQAQAVAQRLEAAEHRRRAEQEQAEAVALQQALQAAQGQTPASELRQAADALRKNQQSQAVTLTQQATDRLERLAEALTEPRREPAAELTRRRAAADLLDALGAAQEELLRHADRAAQITDPAGRSTELQRLMREQSQLLELTQQLLQRLQREGPPEVVQTIREAADQMTAARDALQNGQSPLGDQTRSLQRLDEARDRLDALNAAPSPPERLAGEKHRQLADRLRALLERQRSRIIEAQRLHDRLLSVRRWMRTLEQSYAALAEDERRLAEDLRPFNEPLNDLPVLRLLLEDATTALLRAADRIDQRLLELNPQLPFDNAAETTRHLRLLQAMEQAARRLELVLLAFQKQQETENPPSNPMSTTNPRPAETASADPPHSEAVPLFAQLKILRAWQAEILERTADLARRHPDPSVMPDEAKEELHELEVAQRTVANLFEQLAPRLLGHPQTPEPETSVPPLAPPPRPAPGDGHSKRHSQALPLQPWLLTIAARYASDGNEPVAPPPRPVPAERPHHPLSLPESTDDPYRIVERIIRQARHASQELARANAGPDTQQTQRNILADIDALLQPPRSSNTSKNSDSQPPPSSSSNSKSGSSLSQPQGNKSGSEGSSSQNKPSGNNSNTAPPQKSQNPLADSNERSGQSVSSVRRPRQTPHPSPPNTEPQARKKNTDSSNADGTPQSPSTQPPTQSQATGLSRPDPQNKPSASAPTSPLRWNEDWIRNVWGHLPDALRRQASEYYRQELIPQYSKLLEKYYSSRLQKK